MKQATSLTLPPPETERTSRGLLGLVGWRILLLLLPALFAALQLAPFSDANFRANFHDPTQASPTFATRWATWDAQHYLSIARHGYSAGHVSSAFWPLWPGVVRLASQVTSAPELATALAAANLLAIAAAIGLWHLIRHRSAGDDATARRTATWTVVFLLAFPSAFFFGLPYSESLFLALSVGLFLALDRTHYGWAALAAFALPLTRPVGLFVLLPIACHVLQQSRGSERATSSPAGRYRGALVLLLAPVAGAAAYFLIHLAATGEAAGAFAVRGVFATGQSLSRIVDLPGFLHAAGTIDGLHTVTGSLLDRCLFAVALVALPWLYRRDRVFFWYVVPLAVVPAMSLRFMAFSRFALVLFPIFWAAAEVLLAPGRALQRWGLLSLALGLQLWLFFRHSLNLWAG